MEIGLRLSQNNEDQINHGVLGTGALSDHLERDLRPKLAIGIAGFAVAGRFYRDSTRNHLASDYPRATSQSSILMEPGDGFDTNISTTTDGALY